MTPDVARPTTRATRFVAHLGALGTARRAPTRTRPTGPTSSTRMHPLLLTTGSTSASSADVRRRAESRLRRVCAEWPAEQFASLIADVVRFHERWDSREARASRGGA